MNIYTIEIFGTEGVPTTTVDITATTARQALERALIMGAGAGLYGFHGIRGVRVLAIREMSVPVGSSTGTPAPVSLQALAP